MAESSFTIGPSIDNDERSIEFTQFLSIIRGRSIVSAADWGSERFELGLSGGAMIRWISTEDGLQINVLSTVNADEIPPIVLSLGDMPQRVEISVLERKLRGLRTLYAIFLLAQTDRLRELESYIRQHPHGDVARALIGPDEALYMESMSYGSWLVALWTGTKSAYNALTSVGGLVFSRGREAFVSKLEGESRLLHAQAHREEIGAETDLFNLRKSQLDYLLEVTTKVEDPAVRKNLESMMISAARQVVEGDAEDETSYKALKAPKREK
jgi:hypothetical protein